MKHLRTIVAGLAVTALTAGLSVAALGADEAEAEPERIGVFSIEGMQWLLTAQAVDGVMTPVPEGVVVSLYMEGGEAGGTGGCNQYSTSYELDGFALTFGPIRSTLMACQSPAGEVESAYLANLGGVAAYQSGGIQMALLDADGEFLLEFDLAPAPTIVGDWQAQAINNGTGGVVSSAETPTSAVTATFAEDGQLTGTDGCNQYQTTYTIDGDAIDIADEIVTTRAACPTEALAQQSQEYFAALGAATTWSVNVNGTLELRDDEGALQVRYEPTGDMA